MPNHKRAKQYYENINKSRLESEKINYSSPWKYLGFNSYPQIDDVPETKPRSATLVACLEWSWSPVHSRQDWYHISTNRSRSHWFFWHSYRDDNDFSYPWIHSIVAVGPRKGINKYNASIKLLEIFWEGESGEFGSLDNSFWITNEGILSDKEIQIISKKVLK